MRSESRPLEFWRGVKNAFDAVWEFEPHARESALDALCPDEETRDEVWQILAALKMADDFMEKPLIIDPSAFNHGEQIGRRIGAYQLGREIGRGGMSVVYLAHRVDGAFEHEVAVKLITPALDTNEIGRRFKRERRILARLNHPNIARLHDGGRTADGWPYLMLEYVPGSPITEYCDRQKLSLAERLAIFIKVCRAVEHAHRNLVIHRDLKPSNILVTDQGEVKLLDFGIAKLIKPDDYGLMLQLTRSGVHLMTPGYASPEQALGGAITEASDIYSLGVVLYELLSGHRPHHFNNHTMGEIVRVIRDADIKRPSKAVNHSFKDAFHCGGERVARNAEAVSAARSTTPAQLRKALKGGLDRIALKALHKDVRHRYQSAGDLIEDLSRYLAGAAVKAHPYTLRYRLEKFARRHNEAILVGAIFGLVLIPALIFILYFLWNTP